jgi:hypothetical protein
VSKEACLTTNPIATSIDRNATEVEILDQVKQMELDREISNQHIIKGPLRDVLKKSRLLRLVIQFLSISQKKLSANDIDLTPLVDIKMLFSHCRIHFVHLPQKEEVRQGQYTIDLKIPIEALGIFYYGTLNECTWSMRMFYTNDSHPNASGYTNITECLQRYLLNSTERSSQTSTEKDRNRSLYH